MKMSREKMLDGKSFFKLFSISTLIYAIFGYFWFFHQNAFGALNSLLVSSPIPIRVDFIGYVACAAPIMIGGFLHGYKLKNSKALEKEGRSKQAKWHNGLFYMQLFALIGFIYGPCIWDNIIIIYRVLGPEQLDLSHQMEIQFIFVYFLNISAYRFFTVLYVVAGTCFLFRVQKRSQLPWVYLFCCYIYSSLVVGIYLGLDIYPKSFFSRDILVYIIVATIATCIALISNLIIARKFEMDFSMHSFHVDV
ncbi:MAG: hypothetical protein ACFFCS_14585 [Candidatus Hodarchaeota archaeon]